MDNGSLPIPLRAIFEALNVKVEWDDSTKTVKATKEKLISVTIKIDRTIATVNDRQIILDVPGKIINGRTLVPLRFISESMGCQVGWDLENKTAVITTKYL